MRLPRTSLALLLAPGALSALFALFALSAAAADTPDTASALASERPLSLDEALDLARRQNKDLQAARAHLAQARAAVDQAWTALLPTVTAQGKYTHNYKEIDFNLAQQNQPLVGLADALEGGLMDARVTGALEQFKQQLTAATGTPQIIQPLNQLDGVVAATVPLIAPAAYPAVSAAKKTYASGVANYDVTETTVLFSAAQSFFAAAGADELLHVRDHAIEVAKQTLDDAKARYETGMVNKVEVTRAELALLRAEQAAVEAASNRDTAYRGLRTIIGLRRPFRVAAEETPAGSAAPIGDLVQEALRRRPEVAALERTIEADDAQAASARWRWAPTLSGFGNARAFNYANFLAGGDRYAWAVGVELDWVLYDAGARDVQHAIAAAEAEESEAKLALLRETVADDILNAQAAVATKRRAVDTARRSVALSSESLDLIRAQHEAGTATQLDLLQAQDALVASGVELAQARFDLALAELALERSAGTFPHKATRTRSSP